MNRLEVFRQICAWLRPSDWPALPDLPENLPWEAIVSASSHHLVTPALAWRLRDCPGLPAREADFFSAVLELNRGRNDLLLRGLDMALESLNQVEIFPLLLKGSGLLAARLYPDRGMRILGDLDLLVPSSRLQDASRILAEAGFPPEGPVQPDHHHHLTMQAHPQLGVGIELHRQPVVDRLTGLVDAAGCFERALPIEVGGHRALLPSPADLVAINLAHGQIEDGGHRRGVPQLRRLLDLAVYLRRYGETVDWAEVDRRFGEQGHRPALVDTLALSEHLFGETARVGAAEDRAAAVRRFEGIVRRTAFERILHTLFSLARAAPKVVKRGPHHMLKALSWPHWQVRLQHYHKRW